jgi:putative membrane protein
LPAAAVGHSGGRIFSASRRAARANLPDFAYFSCLTNANAMYVKRNYGFFMTFNWSKMPFLLGVLYGAALGGLSWALPLALSIPWQPISVMGIAVAFYLGFKNNSSYDRTWEARKIWGSIVNNSRSFGAGVNAFVQGPHEHEVKRELLYRHIAWLTALRHQLRLSRPWEHAEMRLNGLYAPEVCEDYTQKLDQELRQYLSDNEVAQVDRKSNVATQLLGQQAIRLQALRDQGYFDDFRHIELHQRIVSFYEDQGKSERIKNFPFPRQYASTALWLTLVFSLLVPFGMLDVFGEGSWGAILLASLLSGLVIWVFFLMEKIGDYSENPFEGTYNDVPITAIARGIEIDLREMIGDEHVPKPIEAVNGFLM